MIEGESEGTPDLFGDADDPALSPTPAKTRNAAVKSAVEPAAVTPALHELAEAIPRSLHLGASSWSFPGWKGLVWRDEHAESTLSKHGLSAYAQHPMFRTVSLDRAFYRPLSASQYAAYAAQVPEHFRFVVKAPSVVTDATVRAADGRGMQPNAAFLDPSLAISEFVQPALEGLGARIGSLVFQLSPLPRGWLARLPELFQKLETMLAALPLLPSGATVAVEVRDAQLLVPEFAALLKRVGATYCLGLHAKMPPIEAQLPMLRALWPGPLVCRWNLHQKHGAYGYDEAKGLYEPFDRLVDPDPDSRDVLARVIVATLAAGFHSYVTINNKAEGSAPLSVQELAKAVLARLGLAASSQSAEPKV
jgi:uncharacterized protein YecE (DUF72 family)